MNNMGQDKSTLAEKRRGSDYNIYKGKGTIRFSLKKSRARVTEKEDGRIYTGTETGALFFMAAPLIGKFKFDREKQIIFAFNENDIGKLIRALKTGTPTKFYHDPGKNTESEGEVSKTLTVAPNTDGEVLLFKTSMKTKNEVIDIPPIPVSKDEIEVLIPLLQRALCEILGWA